MINDRRTFCARLRKARQEAKMKQEQVARLLRIPVSAVSAMESGKRKVDALELFALSQIYRKPMEWFFSWHPEMTMFSEKGIEGADSVMVECLELLRNAPVDVRRTAASGLRGFLGKQQGNSRS